MSSPARRKELREQLDREYEERMQEQHRLRQLTLRELAYEAKFDEVQQRFVDRLLDAVDQLGIDTYSR